MWHVYARHLKTGKEELINTYNNAEDAVRKIASCYNIDINLLQQGEYYYFMKEH